MKQLGLRLMALALAAGVMACAGGDENIVSNGNDFGSIGGDLGTDGGLGDVGVTASESSGASADGSGSTGDSATDTGDGGMGQPGDPCVDDSECEDYCNIPEGATEGICAEPCPDGICPDGFICQPIETSDGTVDVCVEAPETFCNTCTTNDDCGDADDLCVPLSQGNYCTISCVRDPSVCPPGFTCGLIGSVDDGIVLQQCIPNNGICCVDGDGDVYGEGEGCFGTDCDDSNPDVNDSAPEICDGLDNDCDDIVDNEVIDCAPDSCILSTEGYSESAAEMCVEGVCEGTGAQPCGFYTCEQGGDMGDVCATACDMEDDSLCVVAAHCDNSICEEDYPNGDACDETSDCASDYCNNDVCCDSGECCSEASDCAAFGTLDSTCNDAPTCQGTRGEAECVANACTNSGTVEDDSGCTDTIEADDCGPYPSVFCDGTEDQMAPVCATSCADDSECDEDAYCDPADSTCKPDEDDGQPCQANNWCAGDYCSNGFCCINGDCCQVAEDCPTFGTEASICNDFAGCQGTRGEAECAANFVCTSTGNVEDDSGCSATTEADNCGPYPSVFCTGEVDQTAPVCATSCTDDSECDADAYCDPGDNTCKPDEDDGVACLSASWCISGACNNGFCCAGGDCCAQASDCPASYATAPVCDNTQTCQGSRGDAACVSSVCTTTTGVDDDSACGVNVEANACGSFPSEFCTGDVDQVAPSCAISCATDADCDTDAYCNAINLCVPDEPNGDPCGGNSQCISDYCSNGFCCDGGDCCSTNADCDILDVASACTDVGNCQGERTDGVCQANFSCTTNAVDDDSGCDGEEASDCGAFPSVFCTAASNQSPPVCDSICGSDGDCDADAHCDGGACLPDLPGGAPCDEDSDCQGGLSCADGVCCSTTCTGTCQACNLTGSEGTCTAVPAGQDPNNECGGFSCAGYYFGWSGDTCYAVADVPDGACNGALACQTAGDLCGSQPQGGAAVTCGACQSPDLATCTGNDIGQCTNDPLDTVDNCGTCGNACTNANGTTACVGGTCTPACDALWSDCDGDPNNGCETPTNTLTDCGGCGIPCDGFANAGATCGSGMCEMGTCDTGFDDCNMDSVDGCEVDKNNDENNCGTCGNTCTNSNGSTICTGGNCSPTCSGLWGDCDSNANNGCEQPLDTLDNCNGCGIPCALAQASETCSGGNCAILSCSNGFCDDNSNALDGCEYDLDTNPQCSSSVTTMSSVSGDTGGAGAESTRTGVGDMWLRVNVTEDDYLDDDPRVKVTLISPPGQNYDLAIYEGGCGGDEATSSNGVGQSDVASHSWSDTFAVTDNEYVYIHVIMTSVNTCGAWSLSVDGDA